jgi:hypothetical protein
MGSRTQAQCTRNAEEGFSPEQTRFLPLDENGRIARYDDYLVWYTCSAVQYFVTPFTVG